MIINPYPNLNGGFVKPPLQFAHGWVLYPIKRAMDVIVYPYPYRTYMYTHKECRSVLVKPHIITVYRTVLGSARFLCWMPLLVFFGLPIGSCSMMNSLILGCLWTLVFVLNYILTLGIWRSDSFTSQDVFVLDLLSEYRSQHGAIGPIYVTSSYST